MAPLTFSGTSFTHTCAFDRAYAYHSIVGTKYKCEGLVQTIPLLYTAYTPDILT